MTANVHCIQLAGMGMKPFVLTHCFRQIVLAHTHPTHFAHCFVEKLVMPVSRGGLANQNPTANAKESAVQRRGLLEQMFQILFTSRFLDSSV